MRAEVSDLGGLMKLFRYTSYGAILQSGPPGATPTLLGFAGELSDPSGLLYLRARWYDPGTGRFMSRDPEPGSAARPRSQNPYTYAYGSPTVLTDPTGRCPMCWGAAFGFVGYAVYTRMTGQPFDPAQAAIATAAGAATGGLSVFIGEIGFVGASAIAMRAGAGAAVGGIAQIASLDVRMLRGEALTREGPAEIPAAMFVGAAANAIPVRDPDIHRGPTAFIAGVGLGGANAVVGNALQDVLKRFFSDSGGAPSPGLAK